MSTAEDYLQFAQMLINGGELNGRRLLSPRTVDLMASNHVGDMFNGKLGRPAHGMGYGLLVGIVEDSVAAGLRVSNGSFGWDGAFGTQTGQRRVPRASAQHFQHHELPAGQQRRLVLWPGRFRLPGSFRYRRSGRAHPGIRAARQLLIGTVAQYGDRQRCPKAPVLRRVDSVACLNV